MQKILVIFVLLFVGFNTKVYAEWYSSGWTASGKLFQDLSIRNKLLNNETSYEAIFTVLDHETEEKYTATITVKGDDWGTVFFPDNFKNKQGNIFRYGSYYIGQLHNADNLVYGKFSWNCIVEDYLVGNGSFYLGVYDEKIDLRNK